MRPLSLPPQLRAQADAQLQAAQDTYDDATEMVVELHDEDINELRSYFNPPGAAGAAAVVLMVTDLYNKNHFSSIMRANNT